MTEAMFQQTIEAAIRAHRTPYRSGEPAKKMEQFMAKRGRRLGD